MQMYTSYAENHKQLDAKILMLEVIEEEYKFFSSEALAEGTARQSLDSKITELQTKLSKTSDYDTQMYYAEKIDLLQSAIEILQTKN